MTVDLCVFGLSSAGHRNAKAVRTYTLIRLEWSEMLTQRRIYNGKCDDFANIQFELITVQCGWHNSSANVETVICVVY